MRKIVLTWFLSISAFLLFASVPREEYPRPQFERTEWINLNGDLELSDRSEWNRHRTEF